MTKNAFDDNNQSALTVTSNDGNATPVKLWADPTTHGLILGGSVGTITAPVKVGQTTSNTSAVQLSAVSTPSVNGILVQGLSGNALSVYIGGSGVTTSTGYELQAGQAVPFSVANITSLYVIGGNNSDGVCWNVL